MSCFAYSNVPYLKFATMAKRAQNPQAQKSLHVFLRTMDQTLVKEKQQNTAEGDD